MDPLHLRPKSEMPGLAWPALPSPSGTSLLSIMFQLEQTQWWTPQALLEQQLTQFGNVFRHAVESVAHYRERFTSRTPPATLEEFRRLPLLTRADIKRSGDRLFSTRVPARHGRIDRGITSGSSGRPIHFRGTQLAHLFTDAVTMRDHLWRKRDFSKKLLAIRKMGTTERRPGWGPATDNAFQSGPCLLLDIRTDVVEQIDILLREQPEYLLTFPSNLHALARVSLERGLQLPFLREVRTISETLRPETRELCRQAWNAPLTDIYSTREAGYLALQCPEHLHYHVQAECALVEILDAQGQPCAPGQMGRVVLTNLHNFAMPLIRYDIGDYAIAGSPCACGRGLPVIERIVGRERNLLTLPDGRRCWPVTGYERWGRIDAIEQFQLVQKSPTTLEARLVTSRELTAAEHQQFVAELQDSLEYPFAVTVVRCAQIARGPGGKYEDFISEVSPP